MLYMKILFIVMVSMALVAFSEITFKGDAHVQTVAIILSGLFITWHEVYLFRMQEQRQISSRVINHKAHFDSLVPLIRKRNSLQRIIRKYFLAMKNFSTRLLEGRRRADT